MSYSVDTNVLVDAWRKHYPPDVFKTFPWNQLVSLVDQGRLVVIDEVLRELEKKDDEVLAWVKARRGMIVPLEGAVQRRAIKIINDYPSLVSGGVMRGAADPFVIALAEERGLTVVTSENFKPTKPKIPDVCKAIGRPCINLVELFRREGWSV